MAERCCVAFLCVSTMTPLCRIHIRAAKCTSRCMSYVCSPALFVTRKYLQSVSIALVIRTAGRIAGRIERGIAFHSMQDTYCRSSAASPSCFTICAKDTSQVVATELAECFYRVQSRISVLII